MKETKQKTRGPGDSREKLNVCNHKRGGRFRQLRKALKGAIRSLLVHRRTLTFFLTLVKVGLSLVRWWRSHD